MHSLCNPRQQIRQSKRRLFLRPPASLFSRPPSTFHLTLAALDLNRPWPTLRLVFASPPPTLNLTILSDRGALGSALTHLTSAAALPDVPLCPNGPFHTPLDLRLALGVSTPVPPRYSPRQPSVQPKRPFGSGQNTSLHPGASHCVPPGDSTLSAPLTAKTSIHLT